MTSTPSPEPPRASRFRSDSESYKRKIESAKKPPADSKVLKLIKEHKGKIILVVVGVAAVVTGIYVGPPIYRNRQEKRAAKEERAKEQEKEKIERTQTPNPSIKVEVDYQFKDGKIDIKDATPKATIDGCEKEHQLIATEPGETQIEGGGEFTVPVTLVFDGHKEKETIQYTATIWAHRNDPTTTAEIDFSLNNQPQQ